MAENGPHDTVIQRMKDLLQRYPDWKPEDIVQAIHYCLFSSYHHLARINIEVIQEEKNDYPPGFTPY